MAWSLNLSVKCYCVFFSDLWKTQQAAQIQGERLSRKVTTESMLQVRTASSHCLHTCCRAFIHYHSKNYGLSLCLLFYHSFHLSVIVCLSVCSIILFIFMPLSVCLFVYCSIILFIFLSLSVCLFVCSIILFIFLSLSVCLSVCLLYHSFYLSVIVCLSVVLSICRSFYLLFFLSVVLSIIISVIVCLSVSHLSIVLSVYISSVAHSARSKALDRASLYNLRQQHLHSTCFLRSLLPLVRKRWKIHKNQATHTQT